MPEPIETDLPALIGVLARQAFALDRVFRHAAADILWGKDRSLRDASRALKAQHQCRTAFRLLLALRAAEQAAKNREIERTNYWKRKIPIMTTDLHRPPPKAPRGPAKRRHKPWSPERRAKQAELIRALKPWQKSTGPRTDAGRARASSNALKHGFRSRPFIERVREERRLIREAARTIALAKRILRSLQAGAISGGSGVPCRSCGAAKAGGGIPSSDHELSLEPERLAATPALV